MPAKCKLLKRADTNEELARPGAGTDTPSSEYQYVNPFANKRNEENMVKEDPEPEPVVASIQQHKEPKMLPPRDENRKHYDEEVLKEINADKDKTSRRKRAIDYTQLVKELNPADIKLLKLVQRRSGQDPFQAIYPFSGITDTGRFMRALNNLSRKGLFEIQDNKPVKTEVTDRAIMTYDASKTPGTVVAKQFKANLLHR